MKCPFRVKTFNHHEFINGKAIDFKAFDSISKDL